jgi:hypothetical protein
MRVDGKEEAERRGRKKGRTEAVDGKRRTRPGTNAR